MESSTNFAPPPPPPPIKGPLPTKRLETQIPAEAPACVQNAMMTKDKKPFTYTPGGIDLSQIKSPRMAKRVQKNALSEGVTGPPKVSPLAQPNQTQAPPPCMAKDVTGMPFQVFPTGPPAPPPMPAKQQQQQQQQNHPENGTQNGTRKKSPQPPQQHFEPPPMGFRPEIKIPQNPMANLKPTPRPQQNDDFWIEEYKSDKAAEPVLGAAPVTAPPTPQSPPKCEPEQPEMKQEPKHTSFHDKKGQLGSLYIPAAGEMDKQLKHQQSPPWMSSNNKQPSNPTPEWVNSPQVTGERRIPIQIERTPTKTPAFTPMTPNLCPTPFYGANKNPISAAAVVSGFEPNFQVTNHVNSPQVYTPPVQYNPNQFVNQGYHNVDFQQQQQQQQRQQTPQGTSGVTRIIPIKLEGTTTPVTPPTYRGPVAQSPIVVQSDPRQPQQWTNNVGGAPTQSRSFKVLQKITDAYAAADPSDMSDSVPMQYQQAHYSKPMSPSGDDSVDNSMRRMKLNDEDQQFMNRVRNQVDDERYLHKEEDPRYRGSAIPSKAFRLLQNMTNSGDSFDDMGPANTRPRQGRPVQSRNDPDEDEGGNKPYVPPSEQQVFEPKKYTGANIPSRSFRLLQAMTQPENAAEYAEYLQQLVQSESNNDANNSSNNINNNNFTHFPFPPPFPPNFVPPNIFPAPTLPPSFGFTYDGFIPPPPTFDPELMMQMMKSNQFFQPQPIPELSQTTTNDDESKPKLTEDLMNDLERLKDVELIDLLDDTTKSILDSLKSLQLQYGIHLDGLDVDSDIECSRRAAELLKSDNKATLYSSLTNLLKRDCSSGSILSMHSLSERHPEEVCELTEEKVNLIRSLSNLLKAESCISATIQSQSRSRLNSFTTSEKSCRVRVNSESETKESEEKVEKDEETTPRVSPVPPDDVTKEDELTNDSEPGKNETEEKNEQQEEDEIDFWASIKSEDDELPPRRPLWGQRKSSFMPEPPVEVPEDSGQDQVEVANHETILNETVEKEVEPRVEEEVKNDNDDGEEGEVQPKVEDQSSNERSEPKPDVQEVMNDDVQPEVDDQCLNEGSEPNPNVQIEGKNDDVQLEVDDQCLNERSEPEVVESKVDQVQDPISDNIDHSPSRQSSSSPHPTEDTMSIDIEQEIRDLHEYEALNLPLEEIAPPEDFQDQKTPTAENQPNSIPTQPYANWTPEQYAYMMHAMYHNYYGNPANSALLANPVYYHQYLAYQQYIQNYYHQQSQMMQNQDEDSGDYAEQSDNSLSEWFDVSQQEQEPESYYEDPVSERHQDQVDEVKEGQDDVQISGNPETMNQEMVENDVQVSNIETSSEDQLMPEPHEVKDPSETVPFQKQESPVMIPEIQVNALDDEPRQQNIDLVVEDHTELLEEAIVEGKMLIIPSEIVSGDTSLSADDEISTSCTVVTATTIEKRPVESGSNSDNSDQIVVYQIDDQSPTVSLERPEYPTSECESMGEEEQDAESLHHSDIVEEEQSDGEEGSDGECDDIPPLTYFKNNVNEHLPHQLSVIFEVTEYSERASVRSSSVDSESEISHEITAQGNHVSDDDTEDVKVSISLPLRKSETKEDVDINVVVNLSPKGPSLERTYSGSRHNSMIEENDSDISVSVSLPLKRNKFSNVALNVAEEEPMQTNINESFDAYESLDMDDDHVVESQPKPIEIPKPPSPPSKPLEIPKPIEIKHQEMHPMQYSCTTDDSDTDSNMGDNEYETSAQSSSTMINEQSLSALSNLNNFINLQSFNRASSVPPSSSTNSDNKTDEAIQRRFQTLREQWGQLAKANNEVNNDEEKGSSWKFTFFDANQDLFKKPEEDPTPIRPQSCLPIQRKEDEVGWWSQERAKSEFNDRSPVNEPVEMESHVNWWPKRKVSSPKKEEKTEPAPIQENWWPKNKVSTDPVPGVEPGKPSENTSNDNWWPKRRVSPKKDQTSESRPNESWWPKRRVSPKKKSSPDLLEMSRSNPESDENTNWWPKRKVSVPTASPTKQSPPRQPETTPLKYRMVQVQALDSESDSMGDSESEEEIGSSHASLSESSSNSWMKSSSKTLKPQMFHSSSSNNYHSATESTTSDYERARSCPRQSVVSDRSTSVIREVPIVTARPPRPVSCTREMEPKSENIRFIRASSVTRETPSLSRVGSQCSKTKMNQSPEKTWEEYIPPTSDQSPTVDWINAQTLAFPELRNETNPSSRHQYRSMSVARETPPPVPRPTSCTKEMETLKPEKKTSSLYRQLSVSMERDAFVRQSPCSFTTHPERPNSCTLELDLPVLPTNETQALPEIMIDDRRRESIDACQTDSTIDDPNPCEPEPSPVVLRRRVKRQPRPVSCAGELEKQSYRNSLEGSRLEALTECPVMPTVIEIHHTQPARPSSCTRELEGTWANHARNRLQQRPRTRAHSVTREITLCSSPAPSTSSAHSEGPVRRMSVRDRVNAIEELNLYSAATSQSVAQGRDPSVKSSIDESEADDDSGVQSSKYVSEVETDNEGFSELRKMTPYQRANTQTKLYQYLQECVSEETEECEPEPVVQPIVVEVKPKKIIHNVSATRRQNPEKIKDVETPQQRRQRLSLPLVHQHSSGIESVDSSVASPSSPVREKLVNELVQSLLLKKDGRQFRNIPLEKLHAAALKILQEEEEQSHAPSTAYSTPAQTPSEFQLDSPCSYEDYHASWQQQPTSEKPPCEETYDYSVFPSKTFKRLHDQVCGGGRRGSLPKSPLLKDGAHPSPHSHSPSPFGPGVSDL